MKQQPNYTFALTVVIIVCFLLGFVTTMNNSMIDFCKQTFGLTETQGQLVNTAFYGAYILSIPLGILMKKLGYKTTLVLGLTIITLGFVLNFGGIALWGETAAIYYIFLCCMFCVAIGIVLLQLVSNPYVMVLGAPEKGAFRMTLSQTFNSLATTVAPLFVSMLIVSGSEGYSAASIKFPFLGLGIFTLILCLILAKLKLPEINEAKEETEGKASGNVTYKSSAYKYPHVWLALISIIAYMGVEIGIPSLLPAKIRSLGIEGDPTSLLSFYWGGMLVGRALGTIVLTRFKARPLLATCLSIAAVCVALSFVLPGVYSIYALILTGLFHSVMWPLIFNLGLQDLGPHTKEASGVINTGVIGAAILPLIMGSIVDSPALGLGVAVGTLFIYYAYILWFTLAGSKIRSK